MHLKVCLPTCLGKSHPFWVSTSCTFWLHSWVTRLDGMNCQKNKLPSVGHSLYIENFCQFAIILRQTTR